MQGVKAHRGGEGARRPPITRGPLPIGDKHREVREDHVIRRRAQPAAADAVAARHRGNVSGGSRQPSWLDDVQTVSPSGQIRSARRRRGVVRRAGIQIQMCEQVRYGQAVQNIRTRLRSRVYRLR